jgi:gamma-glutamyl hercynylcysteine S-oxide synthase
MKRLCFIISGLLTIALQGIHAQQSELSVRGGIKVTRAADKSVLNQKLALDYPLFTFQVDGELFNISGAVSRTTDSSYIFSFINNITGEIIEDQIFKEGWKCRIVIRNNSDDTVEIENVVPFGETPDHIYLTSTGPWALARAKIFRPGLGPIGVILPDNAWEMGYGAVPVNDDLSVCAIARRTKSDQAEWRRYRTIVYPHGNVEYTMWIDEYSGEWQNGLKLMFQHKFLYDLDHFEDSLYYRPDLQWIRHDYLIGLQFAWNRDYYDWQKQEYTVDSFLEKGKKLFGGYDVIGLWPTWPRLGVDQRNQWDLFSDLPGGLDQIKRFSQQWKQQGTKFFICYNPWDESTRSENPYAGMAGLIEATDADGVVLDCHGASSFALQHAADSVKPGVIMYSEGMAVVKDMPGIVAGRVHDAIYLPPPLNLNKLIKPDFAIFRVCQIHDGRIRREASVAFFNGYGTELNTFAPGQFDNMEEDLLYLGMTTRLLRENTSCFLSGEWTPLLPTIADSIWVNKWPLVNKTLYTVFSLIPEGFTGPLFMEEKVEGKHLVSLWHHDELDWIEKNGKDYIPATTFSFNKFDLDTRAEGAIDCIALLPALINDSLRGGYLRVDIETDSGDELRIWAGNPSYQNTNFREYPAGDLMINLQEAFGNYQGKFVIQLFKDEALLDEKVLTLEPGTPCLVPKVEKTLSADKKPDGMILIPSGTFSFTAENTDQFIPYPDTKEPVTIDVNSFYIDKYPITNTQYLAFMTATGYKPADTINFLKHWDHGKIPAGMEEHPVVYVSTEDARAYAEWAGKRLPTEVEWQYAAQGNAGYTWPWGNKFDSTRCNNATGKTTAVNAFPKGKSPFGVMDMTGNVWQLTGDVYNNGTYYFIIMKGGSHYKPTSSWWYVKGGPQPNNWHQQLLLVSPSFDRNATVGFRCVKDVPE